MSHLGFDAKNAVIRSYAEGVRHLSPASLDSTERSVVLLARRDRPSSSRKDGIGSKLMSAIFGIRRPNKLADLRLEALRRFSVAVAAGKAHLIEWEKTELRALRFTDFQIGEAEALAAQFRRPGTAAGRLLAAAALVLLCGVLAMARDYIDGMTAGVLLTGAVLLPLFAVTAPYLVYGGASPVLKIAD